MTAYNSLVEIDLNCDLGEGMDTDASLMPYVSSVNIACGFHAGDYMTMAQAVSLAMDHELTIGAHPGLPDKAGFGRRVMPLAATEIGSLILYQVGALRAMVIAQGGRLAHVKPHGALYHMAEADTSIALAIARSVQAIDPALKLVGQSGGRLVHAAGTAGLIGVNEVFADRAYRSDGSLMPRGEPGAIVADGELAATRIANLLRRGKMVTPTDTPIALRCDTVCIHGDSEGVTEFLPRFVASLREHGISIRRQGHNG